VSPRYVETTVTFLAMSTPPRHFPPMPASPRLALMKAENIPLDFYRYLYQAVGENWLWFERFVLDDAALAQKVHRKGIEISVLYANGAPAGYFELDFKDSLHTNLAYFGLVPDWTGAKIGPWLLGCAIAEGFSRGARELTVNTCTLDHRAALPLYQRLGFRPVRQELRRLTVPPDVTIPGHIAARMTP